MTKFDRVIALAEACGAITTEWRSNGLRVVPLLGWYDYTFGLPDRRLQAGWTDFRACRWTDGMPILAPRGSHHAKGELLLVITDRQCHFANAN